MASHFLPQTWGPGGRWPAVLALLLVLCGRAGAQGSLLIVRPLRDAGSLPTRLNVRLTSALERFLTERSGAALTVAHSAPAGPAASLYRLEGDVSYAAGRKEDAGRYLMTVRLFRCGGQQALIGQWTGVSSSLRTLTANLHHEPGLNLFGLVGELGARIAAAVTGDSAATGQRFGRLVPRMRAATGDRVEILSAGQVSSLKVIKAGAAIRLRFRAVQVDCTYRLLAASATGELRLSPLGTATPDLYAPQGRRLTSADVRLPYDTLSAWVVWRSAVKPPPGSRTILRGYLRLAAAGDEGAETPAVRVLDGVGTGQPEPDPAVEFLLTEISREPARWNILRLPVGTDRN